MEMWCIWKERNGRIFRDKMNDVDEVWKTLKENLMPMICSMQWSDYDKIIQREESYVAENCGLDRSHMDGLRRREKVCKPSSPNSWSPPLFQVFKLNFDETS